MQSQALCGFLKNSPKFGYSLTIESRNPKLDPIVDFLTENPQGNCEYFSSALTLMLRSVGIRSRMIIGYQGSEWNPLGGYYQIRQQDAHSWTEAYVPPGELKDMPSGAWLRLDPTPGRMQIDEQESSWWITRVYQQMRNYTEFLWANYVIRLDSRRQREEIYSRVTRWGNSILNAFSQLLRGEQSADGEDETGEQQADSASPAVRYAMAPLVDRNSLVARARRWHLVGPSALPRGTRHRKCIAGPPILHCRTTLLPPLETTPRPPYHPAATGGVGPTACSFNFRMAR